MEINYFTKNRTKMNYIFTDNTLEFIPEKCDFLKYAVWQKEKAPETGHIHYQGYIELTKKCRITALKKIYPTIHFEIRKGTQQQAIDYCKKEETRVEGPFIFGTPKKQGKRNDLIKLKEYAVSHKRKRELPEKLYTSYAQYPKFYSEMALLYKPESKPRKTILLVGLS